MEEEDLEDAACILDHLLVEGIRIVSSRLEFVRWLTLREDNENVEGLDVGVFKAYKMKEGRSQAKEWEALFLQPLPLSLSFFSGFYSNHHRPGYSDSYRNLLFSAIDNSNCNDERRANIESQKPGDYGALISVFFL
ncbi:hypothetical protein Bca4012_022959 [Brassica carinata]